ncbi:MAG: hypothetical protein SFU25_04625 [Candidatus Caenarcaniphilales bacterium]|nr:hypothetical protein [Candidatus Caenarcaniphilales bacterium]
MLDSYRYELIPLCNADLQKFVLSIFTDQQIEQLKTEINKIKPYWHLTSTEEKLSFFDKAYLILFSKLYPQPKCSIYASQEASNKTKKLHEASFTAVWYSYKWEIKFNDQTFFKSNFEEAFGDWLNESFHGLLDYLSLIVFPSITIKYTSPPYQVIQSARLIDLNYEDNLIAWKLSRKNLLARIDWAYFSVDSYYLNMETMVDSLAEITFLRIYPSQRYRRGYERPMNYIQKRYKGECPMKAAIHTSPSYETKSLQLSTDKKLSKIDNSYQEAAFQESVKTYIVKLNLQCFRDTENYILPSQNS